MASMGPKSNFKPVITFQQKFPAGEAHSFDPNAFDDAISSQGVPLIHWRAMICPIGIVDKDDVTRRVHHDHPNCANGYLYHKIGIITPLMVGNSTEPQFEDIGLIDGSTVTATFPRKYLDCDVDVHIRPFDRFDLADETLLWPEWEILEYNGVTGKDKLKFPVKHVDRLIDNQLREYKEGEDFKCCDGHIVWIEGGKNPGFDLSTEQKRGRIYSVWYLYQPSWYCQRLTHDLRVVQVQQGKERRSMRMPFEATLVREHVYLNQQAQDGKQSERTQMQPPNGSVPAR